MGEQTRFDPDAAGPGNRTMAATLLETLTIRGRLGDRERAARAAGLEDDKLIDSTAWLASDAVARMLAAANVKAPVARALGHRLVSPESLGMPLYALGLATPEKAFRRVQALLPREALDASWLVEEIEDESACLSYRPNSSSADVSKRIANASSLETTCAMRRGMLEAIPTLYGLLPATVDDLQCTARGDSVCRYRIAWQRYARRGRTIGASLGAGLGLSTGLVIAMLGTTPWIMTGWGALTAILITAVAALLGHCFDLAAQLNAVGGTRRGQLALFEQVDDQLAAKLDALARADSKLEETPTSFRVGLSRSHTEAGEESSDDSSRDGEPTERERGVLTAARAIHSVAGDLECWFDQDARDKSDEAGTRPEISAERGRVREIRDWSVRIIDEIASKAESRQTLDLAALVARGIASIRPLLPANAVIHLEADDDLEPVHCEPVQIEQVIIQLVRNAIEASEAIMEVPEATVSLRSTRSGVEIAVEDRGAGIESSAIDEVFDPFFGDAPLGTRGGFGLPICLRIVEAHGGELRIETEDRSGTRITVFLPKVGHANP